MGKIGQQLVEQRNYAVSTENGRSIISPDTYGSVVKRGTVVVMNMMVLQERAASQKKICPGCHGAETGIMEDEGWLEWYVSIVPLAFPLAITTAAVGGAHDDG
jgi:hypothetical protein